MGSKFLHSSYPAPSYVFAQKRIPLCPEMSSGQFQGKAALRGALRNSKLLSETCSVATALWVFLQTDFIVNRGKGQLPKTLSTQTDC